MEIPKRFKEMINEIASSTLKVHDATKDENGVVSGVVLASSHFERKKLHQNDDLESLVITLSFTKRQQWLYPVHNYLQE